MDGESTYLFAHADEDRELVRLRSLEAWQDPITIRHLLATGLDQGWRCLEVGAGGGSIARWLAEQTGAGGSVVATDINPTYLNDVCANVEVRRHDLVRDELESGAFDLVHCRAVIQHLPDPAAGFGRLADAVAPGGWLVIEEGDCGLISLAGPASAAKATSVIHDLMDRMTAISMVDLHFGRKVPGLVHGLGWEDFGADSCVDIGRPGDPAYEAFRLGWPYLRRAVPAFGIDEMDLRCVDETYAAASTVMVTFTIFAAWGRKPTPS